MEPTTPTNQPKLSRAFVSPEDATPETPLWRIVHQGKSAPFAFGDRSRTVRDGRCTAFESVQEFRAFAEFVEQHPDFVLANGSHQDPIDAASIESLPNNRVRYRTQRISGLPAKTVTSALPSVHRDLWVAELPWEPIPLEHRDWLKGKSARSSAKSDIADEETPRCWAGGHNWSTGSMLSEFLAASGWWHGFMPDDLRPAALQTRQLFPHIRVGDYFAIKGASQQGLLKVCFTGTVAAIDATEQRLRLTPLPLPQTATIKPAKGTQTVSGTLREVTDPAVIDWMFHQQPYLSDLSDPSEPKVPPMPETQDTTTRNTILYGPPGTGKTYITILQAVATIDGVAPETLIMETAKPRWDILRGEGRIEFVTFHQSYGYEDFVEGIRPVMTDEAAQTPRYEVFDGILKRVALRALGAMLEPADTIEMEDDSLPSVMPDAEDVPLDSSQIPFDTLWRKLQQEINDNPNKQYEGQSPKTRYRFRNSRSSIAAVNVLPGKSHSHTAPKDRMNRVFDRYRNTFPKILAGHVRGVEGESLQQNLACVLYRELKRIENTLSENPETVNIEQDAEDDTDPFSDYPMPFADTAEEYLQNADAAEYRLNTDDPPRYVLVIDEINRGNISKIFGELITLIEDDKRIGAGLALTVTLPHSRDRFGLPANLYLLGTMNTADKSIALVDVALRRRFEFEEMMPRFAEKDRTCPGLSPKMREAITRLNKRIVLRKDRDHQIGHAFFRSVGDTDAFNRVFARKAVPLLQEYFYGDWESLRWVLGEAQTRPRFILPLGDDNEAGARNRWQWYRDAGQTLDPLATLVRNYRIGGAPADSEDSGEALDD